MGDSGEKAVGSKAGFWRTAWKGLILIVGYPVAAILLVLEFKNSKNFMSDLRGAKGNLLAKEWGEAIVVAALMALAIRSYLFQPFRIPSGSMIPTLIIGDRLFVNKLAYGPSLIPVEMRSFGKEGTGPETTSAFEKFLRIRVPGFTKPQRGDVIVFRFPVTRDKDFIKRLIAFGGETVEIKDGKVLINDRPVLEGSIGKITYYNRGDYGDIGHRITVPKGYYFVMGDNSGSSHDSRYWGFVPEHFVIGKADVIFWPLNRVGWIK